MARYIASFAAIALSALSASVAACDRSGDKSGVMEQQKETKATEQAATATIEANRQAQGAQANAERDIAAARADFDKSREDYLRGRQMDLAALDRKVADLEEDEKVATGKAKTDIDARLRAMHAQRDAFARHMQTLGTTPATTWDSAKESLDKEWDALSQAVANRSTSPTSPESPPGGTPTPDWSTSPR